MITRFTIELEVEHNGTSTTTEMAEAIEMQLEQNHIDAETGLLEDDFGITKATVNQILIQKEEEQNNDFP